MGFKIRGARERYLRWKDHETTPFLDSYEKYHHIEKGRALWAAIQQALESQGISKNAQTLQSSRRNGTICCIGILTKESLCISSIIVN
jgi:hypothetical protein